MKYAIAFGLATTALVSAAPQLKERVAEPQETIVGGSLGGFAPGVSGFLDGIAGLLPEPFATGELGGAATAPASLKDRAPQEIPIVGGSIEGFAPGASGFLDGIAGLFSVPFATGELGGAATAPASLKDRAPQEIPIVGGSIEGFAPGASGFLDGIAGLFSLPFATGELGGAATAPASLKDRAPQEIPIVGGSIEGFAPGASGFLDGIAGLFSVPFATGELGGAATAPASLKDRAPQEIPIVGGSIEGFAPGASGFLDGIAGLFSLPFATGELGGAATAPASLELRQDFASIFSGLVGGSVVSGPGGFVSGFAGSSVAGGCIGGGLPGFPEITLCAREAEATPAPDYPPAMQ